MKRMKKIVSILLAAVMVLGMSMTVAAEEQVEQSGKGGTGSITIQGSEAQGDNAGVGVKSKTFSLYKVLDAEFANGANADDGVVYKVPASMKGFYAEYLQLSEYVDDTKEETSPDRYKVGFDAAVVAKLAEYKNDSEQLEAFAKAVLTEAKKHTELLMATVKAGEESTSVKVTELPLGYYVIEDVVQSDNTGGEGAVPVSALVLNTTTPDVTVKVKANAPSIKKEIVEPKAICGKEKHVHGEGCYAEDGTLTCEKPQHVHVAGCYDATQVDYAKYNNAAIGDTVNYRVTSPIPNMAGYTKYFFVVTDTLGKGLKFNADSVEVKIDGKSLDKDKVIEGVPSGYTVTSKTLEDGSTQVEIVLQNFIQYKGAENVGKLIEITYSAEVTKDVVVEPTGNANEVQLKFPVDHDEDSWWDDENPDKPKPDVPVGETPTQKVYTFVTGLELLKVDAASGAENPKPLTGAEFTIAGEALNKLLVKKETFTEAADGTYYKLKDGTYTETEPTVTGEEDDNSALYESTTVKYKKGETTTEETEKIEVSYKATVDSSGKLRIDGLKEGNYVITEVKAPEGYNILTKPIYITVSCEYPSSDAEEAECTWKVDITSGMDGEEAEPTIDNGIVKLTVANSSGALLPSTGGIGTTIFYVAGSILVLAAVVLLVAKKRMSAEK